MAQLGRTMPMILGAWLAAGDVHAADARLPSTVDPAQLPAAYHVEGNHHVTAREAHAAVTAHKDIVLIDVRTHEETLFNGIATPMRRHIPYVIPDLDHSYDPANARYKLEPNPDFVKAVDNLLAELKLDRTATLIFYCSVGERSGRAASLMTRSGYSNAYSMVDGFEGDPQAKAGPGWKASGLPWTYRLSPSQAYKSPTL